MALAARRPGGPTSTREQPLHGGRLRLRANHPNLLELPLSTPATRHLPTAASSAQTCCLGNADQSCPLPRPLHARSHLQVACCGRASVRAPN